MVDDYLIESALKRLSVGMLRDLLVLATRLKMKILRNKYTATLLSYVSIDTLIEVSFVIYYLIVVFRINLSCFVYRYSKQVWEKMIMIP